MEKQSFIRSITALQKQVEYDKEIAQNLSKAFPDCFIANLLYNNQYLQKELLLLLQESMNDLGDESWIKYFCFELDFGKDSHLKVSDSEGNNIPMSNADELWHYLIGR